MAFRHLLPSVGNSLQKIETSMAGVGKNVKTNVDKIKEFLKSANDGDEATLSAVETIGEAVPSITSTDIEQIISGTFGIISAVTALIPVAGPIISTVFALISTILGAIGSAQGDNSESIVRREIEKALNLFDDAQLRAEAEGTIRTFRISHAYLNAADGNKTIKVNEMCSMTTNVPIYQGVNFLGILSMKVKELSKSQNTDDVKQAMEYTKLYITLAVLRSATLWEMYALVRTVPDFDWTADAIQRVALSEDRHDKSFIEYLTKPQYSTAVFFAYFNPSQWPEIMTFLEKKGLSYQSYDHLARGSHSLRTEKWSYWNMSMCNDQDGTIAGTDRNIGPASRFCFDQIQPPKDNIFHIRSVQWPKWYVFMTDKEEGHCVGTKSPGPEGEWKVVRFDDGKYMLSPRKWPNWFIFMVNDGDAFVRGWLNDPGIQGHWIID